MKLERVVLGLFFSLLIVGEIIFLMYGSVGDFVRKILFILVAILLILFGISSLAFYIVNKKNVGGEKSE